MFSRISLSAGLGLLATLLAAITSPPAKAPAADTRLELDRAAARIDQLIEAGLSEHGLAPNALTDDATFVRRVYVDIIGRIPTAAETKEFLASTEKNRRSALIDRLVGSPGYVSRQFNYFADLLRVKGNLGRISGEPYIHFLKDALTQNTPYDQMVHQMLSASGGALTRGNGATGYYLRDNEMPQDNMANTLRVFLGTRIECAQCHNHPFDKWTQKQFFEMAAFTGGIRYRAIDPGSEDGAVRRIAQVANDVRKTQGAQAAGYFRNRVLRPLSTGISGSGTGLTRLPKDYQYEDGKPGQMIAAHALFGPKADLEVRMPPEPRRVRAQRGKKNAQANDVRAPQINSREAFAEWLTSPENPRFAMVIANRLFKQVMGVGVVEPVDDLKDDTVASNPALMEALETMMVASNFDLRQFLKVLYRTKTYQREVSKSEVTPGEPYYFPGPILRRLTGEQTWDSLLTLVVNNPDESLAGPLGPRAEVIYRRSEDVLKMSKEELETLAEELVAQRTDPAKYREMQRQKVQSEIAAQRSKREVLRPLYRDLTRARRAGDAARVAEIEAKLAEAGFPIGRVRNRGRGGELLRASDLPQPAPDGHFIRDFGQSDRDQIESSHQEPNVPQVLALMNGFIEEKVLRDPQSSLWRALEAQKSEEGRIEAAYLAILSRRPTSQEVQLWRRDLKESGTAAIKDMVWTLVNSNEFLFLR